MTRNKVSLALRLAALPCAAALALSACTNGAEPAATSATSSATTSSSSSSTVAAEGLNIVTSTSIWADVVRAVYPAANVTALIEDDATDPHTFEPTAAQLAAAESADLVVVGGGGYDSWLYSPLVAAGAEEKIISALPLVEHDHHHEHGDAHEHEHEHGDAHEHEHEHGDAHEHEHGDAHEHEHGDAHEHEHGEGANEHIWFDPHAVEEVADELAEHVMQLRPDASVDASALAAALEEQEQVLAALPALHVAQTESVADYLVAHSPLIESTPAGYRESSLDEQEPSAKDLSEFLAALEDGSIEMLIHNPQSETPATKQLRAAAEKAGIPVALVNETPARGEQFLTFFAASVNSLQEAAASAQSRTQH